MKVFVTGGTGVVGTRAVPALVAAGHAVTAVARSTAKAELVRSMGATPTEVDLFDLDAVKAAVDGHQVVAHLATSIPDLAASRKADAWTMNDRLRTEAAAHLVDAALATGVERVIQESICFPYLDQGDRWITEADPLDHVGPFSGAGAAEATNARFAAEGGTGVVLRFAQFYAPEASHTITFNKILRRRSNPFIGPRDAYMSSIHAEDAGSAVVAALAAPGGTYNVGDDEPLTRLEAGRVAAARLGKGRPILAPRWAQALLPVSAKLLAKSLRISNAAFKEATGWAPTHPSIRDSWPVTG
jgi:nucleoside-diphosphate-sugar epimerase